MTRGVRQSKKSGRTYSFVHTCTLECDDAHPMQRIFVTAWLLSYRTDSSLGEKFPRLRKYASVQYIISDCWPELFSPMILINSPAWTTATYFTVAITSVAIVLLAPRTLFLKKNPNLWAKVFPHHGTPSYHHSLLPIRSPPCLIPPMSCPGPAMSIAPIASWDVTCGVQKKVGR